MKSEALLIREIYAIKTNNLYFPTRIQLIKIITITCEIFPIGR